MVIGWGAAKSEKGHGANALLYVHLSVPAGFSKRIVESDFCSAAADSAFLLCMEDFSMKRHFILLISIGFLLLTWATADEGMWLYSAPPTAKIKTKYGFELTPQWLDHVRLSSVRFNNGGSGSFVSADGLTFTNHHVGAACIQQLSTEGHDYMKTGFYAKTQAEEAKCLNLELDQLVGIEDVTAQIKAAVKPEMSAAASGKAQRAATAEVEKSCTAETGLRCDVIPFYSGEIYDLYKYKKYTDVRLVFAPEFDAAFFGGDPDNFEYPRYDLDISFFRVYENNKPAHLDNYLHWSGAGVRDGELIFVSGNPGSTGRLLTVAQLSFLRDVQYPLLLKILAQRIEALQNFSKQSEENAREAKEDIFSLQNSDKALTGFEAGLENRSVMTTKQADEAKQQHSFEANPKNAGVPNPWNEVSQAMAFEESIYPAYTYLERMRGFAGHLAGFGRVLVRGAEELPKPNSEREREFRVSGLPSLKQQLFSTAPIYKNLEIVLLSTSLEQMRNALGVNNPDVQKVLGGKTPEEAAQYLIDNTKLEDLAVRRQLYDGGQAAIDASTDPLIVAMRGIDPAARSVRHEYEDKVESVVQQNGALIAKSRFEESGFSQPPDATFTLRLSYGAVKGYEENGKQIPFETTIGGAFEHAARHDFRPPYNLPESWIQAKAQLDLNTPLDFVSNADIIGGNSGSPTVNEKGEIVGIIFDGNIQSLVWNFVYDDTQGRAVSVDARGIQEALRKIYHANGLADELMGTKVAGAQAGK